MGWIHGITKREGREEQRALEIQLRNERVLGRVNPRPELRGRKKKDLADTLADRLTK